MPDSFEDRVFNHLHDAYPDLDEDFIRRHPKDLMEMLATNGRALDSVEREARRIPDYLPEDIFKGIDTQSIPPATDDAAPAVNALVQDSRLDCIRLLNLYMQKVLAGDVKDLCVQSVRTDGNHEMMFTLPCNLVAFYGFMTYIVSTYIQGGLGISSSTDNDSA